MTSTPASILKDTFGYSSFLPLQQTVIENILAGKDTLAIMPTGGGKSLCYQIPALLLPGLTVVVSPLIALMKDQVEQLHANGVPSVFLNSTLSFEAYQENMEHLRKGEVKLLYVAPETLLTPRIFNLLDSLQVDLITIDEAHCISEWGHDFRPEYRQLANVRKRYPKATCLALTATATPRVRKDIKTSLGFSETNEFIASFNRENLYISVEHKTDSKRQTLRFLERFRDQSGIIYCFSRKGVDDLAKYLNQHGFSALPYHAGLDDIIRRTNQEAFIRDNVQIIVATIAFGMGINKPNVRFVLHFDLPKSIEGYYQEIGRAGRDGLPAHCLLLYGYGDATKLRFFIDQKQGTERQVAEEHLDAIVKYAEDTINCRRKPLLNYFGEPYQDQKCNNCDNCLAAPPVLADITIPAQKFLSCVIRTGENFGAGHVTDVLRGSKNEQVLRWGHDKLTTYAIGKDFTARQWNFLARQLLKLGYLEEEGEYHILKVTEKSRLALKNRTKIMGSAQLPEEKARREELALPDLDYNRALYSILQVKRKELADQANVPPHIIFSDRTLVEMSTYYPQSLETLLTINGVGQVKLHEYGPDFVDLIQSFCAKHDLKEKKKYPENIFSRDKSDSGRRYHLVGKAYASGQSITNLMEVYGVTQATVIENLTRYLTAGNHLTIRKDILALVTCTSAEQKSAFQAFDEVGSTFLKPAFEFLQEKISYDELKILRLIYLSKAG